MSQENRLQTLIVHSVLLYCTPDDINLLFKRGKHIAVGSSSHWLHKRQPAHFILHIVKSSVLPTNRTHGLSKDQHVWRLVRTNAEGVEKVGSYPRHAQIYFQSNQTLVSLPSFRYASQSNGWVINYKATSPHIHKALISLPTGRYCS